TRENVLQHYARLYDSGLVSRIGPVFRPNTIGVSTLAATRVPPRDLEAVADFISSLDEVNHNYEREHYLNLWFVVTAPDWPHLDAVIQRIQEVTGVRVRVLPLVREFHIDLGFSLKRAEDPNACLARAPEDPGKPNIDQEDTVASSLINSLQFGLPLVEQPYAAVGKRVGIGEQRTIEMIRQWLDRGVIKRFGVVVRHHELGYRANAMVVFDLPDSEVEHYGKRLARLPWITLCYQRPRRRPDWPYNLFCMIHGKERSRVEALIARTIDAVQLDAFPHDVLFSLRRFKQRAACYRIRNGESPAKVSAYG
ncbi:MAG: Lrp/AsnC family transcriptional regulator, partial [Gammaproteobacteria bacterium]|nr:Lrp/AsnC family transcriptional regulator [Gammaproteobacteria bacterium]